MLICFISAILIKYTAFYKVLCLFYAAVVSKVTLFSQNDLTVTCSAAATHTYVTLKSVLINNSTTLQPQQSQQFNKSRLGSFLHFLSGTFALSRSLFCSVLMLLSFLLIW